MRRTEEFEVIIVGGGPAGLCAAMYAGRGLLKAVLLERGVPGGELLNTEWIDDYPGFEHILGRELAQKMAAHAVAFGADIRQEHVESIDRRDDGIFEVATSGGTTLKLEVPGEYEYAGRGVSYCAVCDGAFFKGETLAVVGGGDAAVEEADYLTRYAERVYVIHRRDEFRASKILQERLFANPKIQVIWNKKVRELKGGPAGLEALVLEDTVTGGELILPATGCFIFIGFRPNTGLVKQHFAHDASGYMITDDRMMSSIPGLFAAGDLRVQLTRQVTTAVGDATTAAIAVEKFLKDRQAGVRGAKVGV
jgi:thioredoxin reductase (NADPH)